MRSREIILNVMLFLSLFSVETVAPLWGMEAPPTAERQLPSLTPPSSISESKAFIENSGYFQSLSNEILIHLVSFVGQDNWHEQGSLQLTCRRFNAIIEEKLYGGPLRQQFIETRDVLLQAMKRARNFIWKKLPHRPASSDDSSFVEGDKRTAQAFDQMGRLIEIMTQLPHTVQLPDPVNFNGLITNCGFVINTVKEKGSKVYPQAQESLTRLITFLDSEPLRQIQEKGCDPLKRKTLKNVFRANSPHLVSAIDYLSRTARQGRGATLAGLTPSAYFSPIIQKGALWFYPIGWTKAPLWPLTPPPEKLLEQRNATWEAELPVLRSPLGTPLLPTSLKAASTPQQPAPLLEEGRPNRKRSFSET